METKELEQGDSLLEEKEIKEENERRREYQMEIRAVLIAFLIGVGVIFSVVLAILLSW